MSRHVNVPRSAGFAGKGHLASGGTLAGFLVHRRTALGLSAAEVAVGALLPAARLAAWESGDAAEPAQVEALAAVLRMAEDQLAQACTGVRNRYLWPLPRPAGRRTGVADRPGPKRVSA